MKLAVLLLFIVAGVHYSYDILAAGYADQAQAARNIFYILRGVGGAALFCIVGVLSRRALVWMACALGAFEETQTAACGLAVGIDGLPGYEAFQGLCGAPWYTVGLMAIAGLAVHLLDKGKKHDLD